MEEAFGALYQTLIRRLEPDPGRIRRGAAALRRGLTEPGQPAPERPQPAQRQAIRGAEACARADQPKESGEQA